MGTPAGRHALAATTVTALAGTVTAPYQDAWAALQSSLTRLRETWPRESPVVRRRRVAAFSAQAVALTDQLDAQASPAVTEAVRAVVGASTAALVVDLGRSLLVRRGLIDAAISDLVADLRAAASYTLTTARSLARVISRMAETTTSEAEQARALEAALRDRGLTAVVYRDGSRHGLDSYARMAVRTKLAETWQLASFDLYRQAGVLYVEITDGSGCGWTSHDDPDTANGTIRSLEDAEAYPLSHPHCVRSSFPRPEIRSDDDAQSARPLSPLLIPDTISEGDRAPAVRTVTGRLDTRALAVLAPAAAAHAQRMARIAARGVPAMGDRALPRVGVRRATIRTPATPTQGPGSPR